MSTLNKYVVEINQDSEFYKRKCRIEEGSKQFFKTVNEKYFKDKGFSFYNQLHFGIQGDSEDYETYKDELLKKPNQDGVYIFKKRSKYYPIFKEMLSFYEEHNPFEMHDVLGSNNAKQSQWLGDRWFFSVKDLEKVKNKDAVNLIEYNDYLKIYIDHSDHKREE